jgi:uncharacterized protein
MGGYVLLIETEIRNSDIHGIGLFCKKAISKGTKVWEFHPLFDIALNDDNIELLPSVALEFLKIYGYRSVATREFIVNLDFSRHMNHSDTPNLISDENSNYFARDDIAAGTELTCDYREFSMAGTSEF